MLRFQDSGDYDAFHELFERHKAALFSFLCRLSGDVNSAEDTSQVAWLKIIEIARDRRYRTDASATFRTYLFTIARNHYVDQYLRKHESTRTESLEAALNPLQLAAGTQDPSDFAFDSQLAARINCALMELPFEQREVIALWAAELTIEQMTRTIGAPRDTVLSRKKYALKKLKRALEAGGIEPNE